MFNLTYLGHAGWLIEHTNFKCICDPWFGPQGAFFGEWYPFPQNYHLLTDKLLENLDFIYISHVHEDHYDKWLLKKVNKEVPIYIANFEDKTLRDGLRELGFQVVKEITGDDEITVKDISIRILKEEDSLDNDSCIILNDGTSKILNLNDCHIDSSKLKKMIGSVDLLLIQTSSAIWWPCAYSYDIEEMKYHGGLKRENTLNRAAHYAKYIKAKMTIPNAGPPYFDNENLDLWNYNKREAWNPFVLSDDAVKYLQDVDIAAALVIPGSAISVTPQGCQIEVDEVEKDMIYSDVDHYMDAFRKRIRKYALPKPRASQQEIDTVVSNFSKQLINIKKISKFFVKEIKSPVLFDFQECGKWIIDFTKELPLEPYHTQKYDYSFVVNPGVISLLFREKAIDFERYFLGCSFTCTREPDIYNQFLFSLLKHFDTKRFLTSEKIYARFNPDLLEQTFLYRHENKVFEVQKYCPHMLADLEEIGFINHENNFVCPLHGWKFDLETGLSANRKNACLKIEELKNNEK